MTFIKIKVGGRSKVQKDNKRKKGRDGDQDAIAFQKSKFSQSSER